MIQAVEIKKHIDLLGFKAKDVISGLAGVITSISFDVNGCVQAVVTPPAKDGKYVTGTWLDVTRLELKSKKPVMEAPDFYEGYVAKGNKGASFKPVK